MDGTPIAPSTRLATASDAGSVAEIYNHFVRETVVTFEETPATAAAMARRITETLDAGRPWLVAECDGRVLGFCYASAWKGRCAYRHAVEVTVYVAPDHARRGLGSALYTALLERLRHAGMHAVMGGIALPNDASVALHKKLGFEKVAHFKEVGRKFDRWIDVAYWQRLL